MKIARWFLVGVFAVGLSCSTALGQQSLYKPDFVPPHPLPGVGRAPIDVPTAPSGGLSDWILYRGDAVRWRRDCCEGHPGNQTPLFTELYLRAGPSIPIGRQTISQEVQTGWSIVGGARALFFDQAMTEAWTVDVHIINTNQGGHTNTPFPADQLPANIFPFGVRPATVTVQSSNRTMVGLGVGKEWYLWQPADSNGPRWRVGADCGGRYGSHNVNINEGRHLVDVIGGIYTAVHTDLEIPCKYVCFYTGLRCEWAYTWSDILRRQSEAQDLNILVNMGIRF
jgi:hypothetical protein